jgi:hypothetical protein
VEVLPVAFFFMCLSSPIVAAFGAWWLRLHYRYKERELEVRLEEARARVDAARLLGDAPSYVDPTNPRDVAAWRAADAEVVRLARDLDMPRTPEAGRAVRAGS